MDGFAERAILRFVSEGLPNKRIATGLSIAGRTVKSQIASAMKKLNVCQRGDAAVAAIHDEIRHQPHEMFSQAVLASWTASLRRPASERPPARADSDDAGAAPS